MNREISNLHGKFVVDHAAFVQHWTRENIQQGNILGVSTLAAGLGASAGIFCATMSATLNVKKETLRDIVVEHIDKNMRKN